MSDSTKAIIIRGARQHNLKNIDLEIPRDKLVVITGVSGSGKSSLAFDTIYAEGQRRYVESLSAYARQFLEQLDKPEVDSIEGLSPAISIEQKGISKNPRSTVGTITEVYDYLRLLFARVGQPYCYQCGKEINFQTIPQMVDEIMRLPSHSKIMIMAPIIRGKKGEFRKELEQLRKKGYVRAKIDGRLCELEEEIILEKTQHHEIEVVIDRLVIKAGIERRLSDSLETAVNLSEGLVKIESSDGNTRVFSDKFACIDCEISYSEITPRMFSFNSPYGACPECGGLGFIDVKLCPLCKGSRLKPESLFIKLKGKSIYEISCMTITEALDFFTHLDLNHRQNTIAQPILKEIVNRLKFMNNMGVGYLTLNRPAATLSGGEGQRIRLATQIGAGLMGVLYVLDEPSIGLHPRDNQHLIANLKRLRDLGNTVLVVEHDEDTIRAADYVIDLGPGAGVNGGKVVYSGSPFELAACADSLTGQYLSGKLSIPLPPQRRKGNGHFLVIRGARENNLKNLEVRFPLGVLICVTGISGSGKSTLIIDTLYRALAQKFYHSKEPPGKFSTLEGLEHIDKVIDIDQSPIGRTPRSNPATYTGVFDVIRELFAATPESRRRGYKAGRFSFNVKGGRCEACRGEGITKIEMHFLPDVYVTCDECKGKRYNRDTLEVMYKGKTIADILNMTVAQALDFFSPIPKIREKLEMLDEVGLGYLTLGQSALTLSGGEAQRIKLSRELSRRDTGKTLYLLDEPTTGLHFADVQNLLKVINRLTDLGNTIIIIEHNLEVIKTADYIIDLGPEGGEKGGYLVACGTPEEIIQNPASYTGQYLKRFLERKSDYGG